MSNLEKLKKFIKLICPPIITQYIKEDGYHYSGKFRSYKQAQKFSGKYNDENSTSKFLTPKDVQATGRFNILPILVLSINKPNINILDYGGGANPVYSYIKNSTNKETHTFVIEQEKFCKKIKNKIPKEYEKRVKYISSLDHLGKNNFDIICFNSSIQYLEDYKQKLNKIFKLNPLYVLITKTNFHMGEENYFYFRTFSSG